MLVRRQTPERLEIPHEPGQWIEIRQLSGHEVEEAGRRGLIANGELLEALPQRIVEAFMSRSGDQSGEREASRTWDTDYVLSCAITGWSYDIEPSPASIGDLDAQTREWARARVVERNTRPPDSAPAR